MAHTGEWERAWTAAQVKLSGKDGHICDAGAQTRLLSFLAFLLNHILHWISIKILVTVSKYLVSNWSYTHLIRTIKKVEKSDKMFKAFHVVIIVRNRYFVILKLFWVIKGFVLYQIKQTDLKLGYNFTTYGKFMDTGWIEELQTRKPLSPVWASSSISGKRQATGFEPLRNIY